MQTILLTTRETARFLKISKKTLERMRVEGRGPKFIKVGRNVRYRLDALHEWIETNTVLSTSEVACGNGRD